MSNLQDLIKRGDQLFGARGTLMSTWQMEAEAFYIERADFTTKHYLGEEYADGLTSSYPLMARRELGNAFSAMLRPADQIWFEISVEDEERLDNAGRVWLQWASKVQRRAMYDQISGFVDSTKEADHDFATFGQGVISKEWDWKTETLLYRNWHLRDVTWALKYNGTLREVHRNWKPMLYELNDSFRGKLHSQLAAKVGSEPFTKVNCRHVVIDAATYYGSDKQKAPWVSLYIDIDNLHIMDETASFSPIYTIPRWCTISGSQYGYSPAVTIAIPDARLIQAMTLTLLEAGESAVRPPVVANKEVMGDGIALYAGGISFADLEQGERLEDAMRPVFATNGNGIPFGADLARDTRQQLASAFYLDKLQPMFTNREKTAYETGQIIQKYIREALPLFEPMESRYNGALCEDTFDTLLRVGVFGRAQDMPPSLSRQKVRFKFESPLRRTIERQKATQLMESRTLIEQAVALDRNAIYVMDGVTALREALIGNGTPATWMRERDEADKLSAKAAEDQQSQQMIEQMNAGGAALEQVGKAKQAMNAAA